MRRRERERGEKGGGEREREERGESALARTRVLPRGGHAGRGGRGRAAQQWRVGWRSGEVLDSVLLSPLPSPFPTLSRRSSVVRRAATVSRCPHASWRVRARGAVPELTPRGPSVRGERCLAGAQGAPDAIAQRAVLRRSHAVACQVAAASQSGVDRQGWRRPLTLRLSI